MKTGKWMGSLVLSAVWVLGGLPEIAGAQEAPAQEAAEAAYLAMRGPESFMDRLDADADFVFYLNTSRLMPPLRQEMSKLGDALTAANLGGPQAGCVLAQVGPVLDWLGAFSVRSIGVSMAPVGDDVSRIKSFMEREEGFDDRVLWRLYGAARPLDTLKYLPSDTAAMEVLALNPGRLWQIAEEGLSRFAPVQVSGAVAQWKDRLKADYDLDLNTLPGTLDDEMFVALTLSDSVTMHIPLPGNEPLELPEPGFLLGVHVQNDTLMQAVLSILKNRQIPVSEKTLDGGAVLYTLNLPAKLPFPMNPSMLLHEGCLLLGSTPDLVERAVQSYAFGGELAKSEAFQARFPERPAAVNALVYMDERFSDAYCRLQAALSRMSMIKGVALGDSGMDPFMDYYVNQIILSNSGNWCAGYELCDSFGLTDVTLVKTPYGNPLVSGVASPVAAGFLMGVSAAQKAQMAAEQAALMEEEYPVDGEEIDIEYYDVEEDDEAFEPEEDLDVEYEYDLDEGVAR